MGLTHFYKTTVFLHLLIILSWAPILHFYCKQIDPTNLVYFRLFLRNYSEHALNALRLDFERSDQRWRECKQGATFIASNKLNAETRVTSLMGLVVGGVKL